MIKVNITNNTMKYIILAVSIILTGCATTKSKIENNATTYGALNINDHAELAAKNKVLIENTINKFGSSELASNALVDQGFRLYKLDNINRAKEKFNQAWLLNPSNPESYHGIGSILYEQGDNCRSMNIMDRASNLSWGAREFNRAGFLVDLALTSSLCANSKGHERFGTSKSLIDKSNNLFIKAENLHSSSYLYDKWWQALYWRGNYSEAWQKVFQMRKAGGAPVEQFLNALRQKMPEPKK